MMSEQQFETILAATADLQVAVDALGLDMQRVLEIISAADSPQPPEWVKGGFDGAAGGAEEDILRTDPPPARARVGAAAGLLVITACAALLVVLLVLLYLLGN